MMRRVIDVRSLSERLSSRKFWMAVASFLVGLGTVVTGLTTDNETVVIAGIVLTAVGTAIYQIIEGLTDISNKSDDEILEEYEILEE